MAILPVPTIPDPEPPADLLPRIMAQVATETLCPCERHRLARDYRLASGNAVEYMSLREFNHWSFVRWATRHGVYSDYPLD